MITKEETLITVAEEYGIRPEDIRGNSRKRPLPEARKMCCYIMARYGNHDYPAIAEYVQTDRSNVYLAITSMTDWIDIYTEVRKHFNNIMVNLKNENPTDQKPA